MMKKNFVGKGNLLRLLLKGENDPQKSRVGVLDSSGEKFRIGLEMANNLN